MKTLTIFTPTYNRAYILPKLYDSLKNQTSKDFSWLIVDDGSIDDTGSLVKGWQNESILEIEYIYQKNGGKMRAHNVGVNNCKTKLFFCVDSDDYLTNNAIETILQQYTKNDGLIQSDKAGFIAYKGSDANHPIGTEFPKGLTISTLGGIYSKGFKGDTSLIFKTDVIKQYPFEVVDGEKFITENSSYYKIDQKYKYYLIRDVLIICSYLEDGYTKASEKLKKNNPLGYVNYYNMLICNEKKLFKKIKYSIALGEVLFLAKLKNKLNYCKNKFLFVITSPCAYLVYLKRRKYAK